MNQETLDFYAGHNLHVPKMIHVGSVRKNLQVEAIKQAAESVYQDIHDGKIALRQIDIAWEVYKRAKGKHIEVAQKENDEMKGLKAQLEWQNKPLWERIIIRLKE